MHKKDSKCKCDTCQNHDDKYNIDDTYNLRSNYSSTELTGLVRPAPADEEELDSYNEIFTFKAEDIVVNREDTDKRKEDKSKKYKYK